MTILQQSATVTQYCEGASAKRAPQATAFLLDNYNGRLPYLRGDQRCSDARIGRDEFRAWHN